MHLWWWWLLLISLIIPWWMYCNNLKDAHRDAARYHWEPGLRTTYNHGSATLTVGMFLASALSIWGGSRKPNHDFVKPNEVKLFNNVTLPNGRRNHLHTRCAPYFDNRNLKWGAMLNQFSPRIACRMWGFWSTIDLVRCMKNTYLMMNISYQSWSTRDPICHMLEEHIDDS